MRILTIALMTFLLLAVSGCGEPVGSGGQPVDSGVHQYNPEEVELRVSSFDREEPSGIAEAVA